MQISCKEKGSKFPGAAKNRPLREISNTVSELNGLLVVSVLLHFGFSEG